MEWIEIIIALSTLLLGFYYWSTSTFNFWKALNVVGPAPLPLVGNLKDILLGKTSFGEYLVTIYNENRDNAVVGIFLRRQPALMLIDSDLIKDVLIKDFAIFPDRGLKTFDKAEPLSQHLVNLEPTRWRPLRNKLSPTFTSGKLKKMFYLLLECGEHLDEYLKKLVAKNEESVECRELTAKFTTDVIGTCAFGLQMNALTDDDSEFRKMGREIFKPDWKKILKFRLRESIPWLYSLLGPIITDWKLTNFFLKIMRDTMNYRKNNQVIKHDFIDLIMELRDHPDKVGDIELTDTLLTAQLFVFFLAGFETSSTTMSNTLYELAQHQSIQDRLRNEIRNELAKNNGELTYEAIKSMKYLDMIFKETLRKYPPATVLMRKSADKYTFGGTKLTIPKGTPIIIPVFAIHRDSRIYPKPEVFDPERFTEKAIESRHPMSWLAFGDGPRNCIETLRKYPPATTLTRQATDAYTFNGIGLTIPKNTKIIVPVFGIHRDLRIYNEPEIFDPERFTNEAMKARHTMSWLAFGEGPRNCIASRFADYQTKVGLIKILQNHKVELCEKTEIPYVINPRSFLLAPKNGIYLRIHKIR